MGSFDIAQIKDRQAWRNQCRDLFFFETGVCSQAFQDKFNNFGRLQKRMCDFIDFKKTPLMDKYFSAFRGSYKTTVLMGFFAYFFCWNVALKKANTISYYTSIKDNASNFNDGLRTLLLENDFLHWIFPEMPVAENQYKTWTKQTIAFRDVRMDFVSMDTTLASKHSIYIFNDDIENEKNYRTEFARDDLKTAYEMQSAIHTRIKSKNIGHQVYTCTPYHIQGLTWKIRNETPESERFEAPCFIDRDPTKGSAFPERYTVDDFMDIKKKMSNQVWASQYLLSPQSEEDALCPDKWVKYWDRLPYLRWRSMVIDPGGAEPNTNDATGITIVDSDETGSMFVCYAEEHWLTPMQLMDKINELKNIYRPDDIRIEKEKYSITIADLLQHRFPLLHVSFVEHKHRNKESRIWRLRQLLEAGKIYIGMNQVAFRRQLTEYPASKRDDLLDSLSYHIDIRRIPKPGQKLYLPNGEEFNPQIETTFSEEMERALSFNPNNQKALDNDHVW